MTKAVASECNELEFSCSCGEVAGSLVDVGPTQGDYIVCHCNDCQNFARYLGADARVLGPHNGTELLQGRCAKMRLSKGANNLSCLHLTDKPTLRWYASCCRTPMFNTYANGRLPYLTILLANCDPTEAKSVLGPVVHHLSLPDKAADTKDVPPMSLGKLRRRVFSRVIKDIVAWDRRRSALFDPKTLEPISPPYRLTKAERDSLG